MRLRIVSVFSAWLAVLTIHGGAAAQVARQGITGHVPERVHLADGARGQFRRRGSLDLGRQVLA